MLPKRVLYYGEDKPLPEGTRLRAGPLELTYEAGDLRYVTLGGREILRRVYVAIRDRNWGTIAPSQSNLRMDIREDAFQISYDIENREREIDFAWHGTITGESDGTITFTMDGIVRSTFWRNRIGFCVLHPAGCAGAPAIVERVDGIVERGILPVFIDKAQPVQPFAEMRAMRHEVEPGLWASVEFAGEIFEMEDQRNWTDASFKTFCTPLRLPYPVEIQAGTRVTQSVTLKLVTESGTRLPADAEHGAPRLAAGAVRDITVVAVDLERQARAVPAIGLGTASHEAPLSGQEEDRLRALHLGHLRVDLHLARPGWKEALNRAAGQANALGLPLEAALFLSEDGGAELEALLPVLNATRTRIARWLVYPEREFFGGGSPVAEAVSAARAYLPRYAANTPLASGTNSDLILLQRSVPPLAAIDMLTLAINPQVHAFDNASLMETLEAQGMAVSTARRLGGSLPVIVSPVTLKPRFNPVATGPIPPTPPGELPPQVDPRQMSLFAAAWTMGSIKYLAGAGVQSATYYETTGWRGVMETGTGSPLPDKFPSLPGSVFPLYHVLAEVGQFAGGEVVQANSAQPLAVESLALRKERNHRVLLANMTARPQSVTVQNLPATVTVRVLDETNAEAAAQQPEAFRSRSREALATVDGCLEYMLLPYAIVSIDF